MDGTNKKGQLLRTQNEVVACTRCPRLVRYLSEIRQANAGYWCRPVPSFGDPEARILLLGLAPGRSGSNRTGRMFTGDASGNFLFQALHQLGFANQAVATHKGDGLRLRDIYITAVVRCAPPQNRPNLEEIDRCLPFLEQEMAALINLRVIVALGRIAHDGYLRLNGERLSRYPFRHGDVHRPGSGVAMVDSYHPSRQNTQTGRLTMPMFLDVLDKATQLIDK
jgi:uracil-DNA glycosylase family 4